MSFDLLLFCALSSVNFIAIGPVVWPAIKAVHRKKHTNIDTNFPKYNIEKNFKIKKNLNF